MEKHDIFNLIKASNLAEDDLHRSKYYNTFLCLLASIFLLISSAINFIFGYLISNGNILFVTIDSIILLILGICFEVIRRTIKGNNKEVHFISALYCAFFVFFLVRYYTIVGPLLWVVGIINIFLSILHYTRVMMVYTVTTMFATSVYFTIMQLRIRPFDAIIQLLIILYFITLAIIVPKIWVAQRVKDENTSNIKKEQKRVDDLTGLPNRAFFCNRIKQDLHSSENVYFLFLDIDQFKLVNDTMGHSTGDLLIKYVSLRLTKIFRGEDIITRYGGDEFLVVIKNLKDHEKIIEISKRILSTIRKPFNINHYSISITCSIGISKYPNDGNSVEALIKKADNAMYTAKEEGKNRFVLYSESLDLSIQLRNNKINLLHQALKRNEFELYYQPQVDINTKKIVGTEGFIRWHHPEKGILHPKDFIPLAEKSGLINEIGEWVLKTACKQNAYWKRKGILNAPVAVNLSMVEVSEALIERVSDILQETKLNPGLLELEIPERMLLNNIDDVKNDLIRLKEIGVKITIDNFGADFLPINLIKEFPIDRVKIPILTIYDIDRNNADEFNNSIVLELVKSLGLEVVVQGVETKGQMDFMKNQFCYFVQGYYICWPLRANEIEGFFLTKKITYGSN